MGNRTAEGITANGEKKNFHVFIKKVLHLFAVISSISGYVPGHATVFRTIIVLPFFILPFYFAYYQPYNPGLAISYFVMSTAFYIGFIYLVLRENGLRRWFIEKRGGEERGYLTYEATLGVLFLNNGVSIGYVASSSPGNLFDFIPHASLLAIAAILFVVGFTVKIWAAEVASIDIYYWKDMFLGRRICDFADSGPYKYLANPMYGIGQLQAYALAIWYGSLYGLIAAVVNQCLIFSFFYSTEKKFIKRIYSGSTVKKIID